MFLFWSTKRKNKITMEKRDALQPYETQIMDKELYLKSYT